MKHEDVVLGMLVIGNGLADGRYSITRAGWIGKVTNYNENEIKVASMEHPSDAYWVEPKCFDPYIKEADKETFIRFLSSETRAPGL